MEEVQSGNHAVKSCGGCTAHEEKEKKAVPYIVHESILARTERQLARSWVLTVILVVLLVATNIAWVVYENQFEDVVTVSQESSTDGGGDAVVNNGGDLNYGSSKADDN